jgi:ribosomal-protein-alanine N-acetyltransferase
MTAAVRRAEPAVRLEPMRWWHIDAVMPLEDELFGEERWTPAMFWSELAQGPTRYYRVAVEQGDTVIGYGGLCAYPDEAWVQTLGVRGDRQRRGIGALLLDDLLAEAERRHARRVSLEVRADNPGAQRLYATRGFEAIGLRRGYYQPSNTDAVVMVLAMPPAGRTRT